MNRIIAKATIGPGGLHFPGKTLFKGGLTFEWRIGSHWGVAGPNGSGKSVFMSLLSQTRWHPDADVELLFEPPEGIDPVRRVATVSLESQAAVMADIEAYAQMRWNASDAETTPTLDSWLSRDAVEGREKWEIRPPDPVGDNAFRRRRNALLGTFGISGLLDRRIVALSNGEMRRALFCRAILSKPAMLLLDAPTIGLDGPSRDILARQIASLLKNKHGPAVIVSTVRAEELPPGLTDLMILDASGRVTYLGPVSGSPISLGHQPVCTVDSQATSKKTNYNSSGTVWKIEAHDPPRQKKSDFPKKTQPALVSMRDVCVSYGEAPVFSHLNWTVRRGEKWLVCGPNGCGKSTLLALICGDHQQAYSQNVSFWGRRRGSGESVWDVRRRIGFVSPEQQACTDGSMSVIEVVLSGLDDASAPLRKNTRARLAKARAALQSVCPDIPEDARFSSLGGGMRRLALLARAVVKKPPLLVLDEPCQNLDETNRKRFLSVVDGLCSSRDATLIFVTHLVEAVPKCIDHVLRADV